MFSFYKMQATGNDFIVLDYINEKLEYSCKLLAEFLCDRHFGVGGDGVLILEKSEIADYKMRIFNKDGTEAEMCGNGIRCLAKYIHEKNNENDFYIETLAGIKKIHIDENTSEIEVDMGKPVFDLKEIPVFYNDEFDGSLKIEDLEVYPISMGNPHAVCFVNDVDNFDICKYGKIIENYKYFPNKTNVEFVEFKDKNNIKVRIWERGVGETFSCGTGVCASSIISYLYKSTESRLIVETKGGKLKTYFKDNIILKGDAKFVFDGKIDI